MKLVDYDSSLSSESEVPSVKESVPTTSRAHSAANLMAKLNRMGSSKQTVITTSIEKSVDDFVSLDHILLSRRASKVKLKTPEELYEENLRLVRQITRIDEPLAPKEHLKAPSEPIQVFAAEPSINVDLDKDSDVEPSSVKQILLRVVRQHKPRRKQFKPRKTTIVKSVETPVTKPTEVAAPKTRSRKKIAFKEVEIPVNTHARRTCGQLAKEIAQAKADATRAKKDGKRKIGDTDVKQKAKRAKPIDIESGGGESDAKNYGSSLKGKSSHATQSEKRQFEPMFHDEYHV